MSPFAVREKAQFGDDESNLGLPMMARNFSIDSEPASASKRDIETARNKFTTSGIDRDDASPEFSISLSNSEMLGDFCTKK